MREFRVIWAGSAGFFIDTLLTQFLVSGLAWYLAGVGSMDDLNTANPIHILVGIILPVLMTTIGGGVAGAIAPADARDAGALVGGWGLLFMTFDALQSGGFQVYGQHGLTMIVSQCVAVVLAAIAGTFTGRYVLTRI